MASFTMKVTITETPRLSPLAVKVRTHLRAVGYITALDAMRGPLGISSGSLTRRLTELRDAGEDIRHSWKTDRITGRRYGVWTLAKRAAA